MKGMERYECPTCGVGITVFIPLTGAPTHKCKKKLKQVRELEKVETRDSKR